MKKNDLVTVEITDLTTEGEGIGRAGAFPLFIKDTMPGDTVRAVVTKLKKNYGYGKALEILEASGDRVPMRCPLARRCGGCQIQEMDYQAQLRFKTRKVLNNLTRIGGFSAVLAEPETASDADISFKTDLSPELGRKTDPDTDTIPVFPCIGMETPWHYRNKAQVPFGRNKQGELVCGFYAGRSHDIIESEDCLLTPPEYGHILRIIKQWMRDFGIEPYQEESRKGLVRHVLLRKGFHTGEILVCLILNGRRLVHAEALETRLKAEIAGFKALSININEKPGNTILGPETRQIYGPGHIEDTLSGVRFRISPQSFYQVNPVQTEILYGKALEFAGLTGEETVWDLYCGIGTISLFLAQKARKVYGVEIVPQAIEDARENARLNGFDNTEFFVGKAEEVLPAWYEAHPEEKIDIITVDPPRKGCDGKCLETIGFMQPERVVYVSCDSATLARDLKILTGYGYRVEKVQPVDQFCQTVEVETVVLLSKLQRAKHHINVRFDLEEADLTAAETKATYDEIRNWIQENYGLHVTNLNIAKTKKKCGFTLRENHNLPKSDNSRSPGTTEEKEEAIIEAFRHFGMIGANLND